jgi:sulfite reductase alpha subunit-like flavoprotein
MFYKWIQNDFGKTQLEGIKFTIFGLGDNTFKKFNTPACVYFQRFVELKMNCIFPIGLGSDHQGNIQNDFYKWMQEFIVYLKNQIGSNPENVSLKGI